ncbi:MAG: formate dehydrogenase accessory sulfurtransferase FdhD [Candidatus Obscuribacterales bacterium]|nr:formate dehydrogenase accessory sulfurtransferase FdhD [Candidatus Obscuribacterales bacterium]
MTTRMERRSVVTVETKTISGLNSVTSTDKVSVEEPLEIRVRSGKEAGSSYKQFSTTMRTPGNDEELAVGFLFAEGIIADLSDIDECVSDKCNVVNVALKDHVKFDSTSFDRHSFVSSSCGVCGKRTIEALRMQQQIHCHAADTPLLSPDFIHSLPDKLRSCQLDFDSTGGTHASCLFDINGNILNTKEDVGRHNAMDKVIGSELLQNRLPLTDRVLLLSGRVSFELVQKAARAKMPVLAAVGAPSSLAIQLAEDCGITLIGFVRSNRFNVYTNPQRILLP